MSGDGWVNVVVVVVSMVRKFLLGYTVYQLQTILYS